MQNARFNFRSKQSAKMILALAVIGSIALAQTPAGTLEAGLATAREKLAPALSSGITSFRHDAIKHGVASIPPEIRAALSESVPADVLDDVRWRIGGETGLIGPGLFGLSSALAVTLDNVIVFAGTEEAADPGLWAHEIYHVMQYRLWGVEGFATRFLADHQAVEREAKEFQYQWWLSSERGR